MRPSAQNRQCRPPDITFWIKVVWQLALSNRFVIPL